MILYKAIKYCILTYCAETLFDALAKNLTEFKLVRIPITDLRVGMKLSRIFIYGDNYMNCTITKHIIHVDESDGEVWYNIEFLHENIDPNHVNPSEMTMGQYDEDEGYVKFFV